MSKIEAKLLKALNLKPARGASRQEHLSAMIIAIGKLSDDEWEELDEDSKEWYNQCADAKNAKKKELPEFPDFQPEEEDAPTPRRRAAKEEASEEDIPAVGKTVKIVTKRGKEHQGKVVEMDNDVIVLEINGEELEFATTSLGTVSVVGGSKKAAKDSEPEVTEPAVGLKATVTTKRGKVVTGKIIELDEDIIVLDDGENEQEFQRDRVESLVVVGAAKKAPAKEEQEEAPTTRRRAAKEEAAEEPAAKTKRSTNEGGVSIGQAIREAILDDLDATEDDIAKVLKKAGLEFKENTLSLNYKEAHKFLDLLKSRKMLKA